MQWICSYSILYHVHTTVLQTKTSNTFKNPSKTHAKPPQDIPGRTDGRDGRTVKQKNELKIQGSRHVQPDTFSFSCRIRIYNQN